MVTQLLKRSTTTHTEYLSSLSAAKALMSRRFCMLFLSDAVPSRGLVRGQVRSLQTATGGQLSIAADTGM
ncbi:hypothetical protein ABH09_08535 [Treponema sp. OMZ 803]|uniref:hypothetical protein n=1 Tax=Treponema sp. OMZ 803 TaxID=120682 RepID=UPI0020A31750|nr:hypothetical protein [Treponema sp. OMZ 803]UTC52399.1 hypothetical protein ABH09_08535 [Treponema sp. OMZ 803]